jgi:hypothetical protein
MRENRVGRVRESVFVAYAEGKEHLVLVRSRPRCREHRARNDVSIFRVLARDRVSGAGAPHFVDEHVSNDHKWGAGEKVQHTEAMERCRFVPGRGELRLRERTPKGVRVPGETREFAESMARDGCGGAGRTGKRTAQFDDPQDVEPE